MGYDRTVTVYISYVTDGIPFEYGVYIGYGAYLAQVRSYCSHRYDRTVLTGTIVPHSQVRSYRIVGTVVLRPISVNSMIIPQNEQPRHSRTVTVYISYVIKNHTLLEYRTIKDS